MPATEAQAERLRTATYATQDAVAALQDAYEDLDAATKAYAERLQDLNGAKAALVQITEEVERAEGLR